MIVSLVAFMMYRNDRSSRTGGDDSTGMEDIRLRVMAEELIGIKSLASLAGPAQPKNLVENQKRLVSQMEESAHGRGPASRSRSLREKFWISMKSRLDSIHSQKTSDLAKDIESLRTIIPKASPLGFAVAAPFDSPSRLLWTRCPGAGRARERGTAQVRRGRRGSGDTDADRWGWFSAVDTGRVGFFIAAVVLRAKGRIGRAYIPDPAARAVYLEAFAIYFILFILGFGLLRRYFGLMSLQWEWLALIIIPIVMLWLSWNGVSLEDQRTALAGTKEKACFARRAPALPAILRNRRDDCWLPRDIFPDEAHGDLPSIRWFKCCRAADGMCWGYTCWSACLRR